MRTVEFKFDVDEMVTIKPTGKGGIVTDLSFGDAGNRYYVETDASGAWWAERQLSPGVPIVSIGGKTSATFPGNEEPHQEG
jgi:uncharacterized protein YodC (DUF2158 family)